MKTCWPSTSTVWPRWRPPEPWRWGEGPQTQGQGASVQSGRGSTCAGSAAGRLATSRWGCVFLCVFYACKNINHSCWKCGVEQWTPSSFVFLPSIGKTWAWYKRDTRMYIWRSKPLKYFWPSSDANVWIKIIHSTYIIRVYHANTVYWGIIDKYKYPSDCEMWRNLAEIKRRKCHLKYFNWLHNKIRWCSCRSAFISLWIVPEIKTNEYNNLDWL